MNTITPPATRRADLDALRAVAMLLGIVLHAALSFFPTFWVVSDRSQDAAFGPVFAAIHGFRMPLFFVMSGFFSAMLLGRRGARGLVRHRFFRVFLPLVAGMFTVVPATNWISGIAMESASKAKGEASASSEKGAADLWQASASGDLAAIERHLAVGADVGAKEAGSGATPLHRAALAGRAEAVELLLRRGADVDAAGGDGGTPLHAAAFLGHERAVEALLRRGATVNAANARGETPLDGATVDEATTKFFASLLRIEFDEDGLGRRKQAVAETLRRHGATPGDRKAGLADLLMQMPLFAHLWFLWFLWWLVLGLAAASAIGSRLPGLRLPSWAVLSPARYIWLVPLTMIPQSFMGGGGAPLFGPDTSSGPLPIPHVLAYYAIFFGFGAIYYGADDPPGRIGGRWWIPLALGLLIALPFGMALAGGGEFPGVAIDPRVRRGLSIFSQAAYPWLMTFGLMGLFRRACPAENATMRYLSDSAYWLYLVHLPLVIGAQYAVRDWPVPAVAKFVLIVVVVTAALLVSYQLLVRHTRIGRFLNGPRIRPTPDITPPAVA